MKTEVKTINSKVFDSFNQLTNTEKSSRINGAVGLLQHLSKNDYDEDNKESTYSLQRMIRGVGASTSDSRTGFYTTLVAFLSLPSQHESPTITEVFDVMDKQLSVGKGSTSDKEDSDALTGHILICGALLHSGKVPNASDEEITRLVRVLIKASHHKNFHASFAYTFLIELLDQLSAKTFTAAVWPVMKKELKRPWEKHNINTVQFLIQTQQKHPQLVDEEFLTASIKSPEILTPLAYKHFSRLFWANKSTAVAVAHPVYDVLGEFLAKSSSKALLKFWQNEINEILLAPSKIKEVVTLKVLTIIFNSNNLASETAVKLLSPAFIKLITNSIRTMKQQRNEHIVPFYDEFFEAVGKYLQSNAVNKDETTKVNIIKSFLVTPGNLLIEKFSNQRFVHKYIASLNADGVAQLYEFYQGVLLNQIAKDPKNKTEKWQLIEKEHSIQMLQTLIGLKSVSSSLEWRTEQLKFLLKLSFFKVNESGKITKDEDSGVINNKLAGQLKQVFYTSLQIKSLRLEDELKILSDVVEFCNETLSKKLANKFVRHALAEDTLTTWNSMISHIATAGKSSKHTKLTNVFKILLLHMGLQLFREPDMAKSAIADLEQCMEKTQKKTRGRKDANNDEPEWIEVVVDLFMHLLSQNTGFLRNVVDSVFPHLCENLSLTAVHQILSILDMRDGKNPLSAAGEAEEEEDDSDSDSDEEENGGVEDDEEKASEDDEDEDEDEEEIDEDDDDDDEAGDEGTATDQLRSVISSALGSAIPETDTESVDLNDMDDDEAERLDNALSIAFKTMGIKFGGTKKTKAERRTQTSVMHFRIRVLDLLEIYLKSKPSLAITLEILLELINMTELSHGNKDLEPLSFRLDRVMKTLLALREYSTIEDVTEQSLVDLFDSLLNRKVDASNFDVHHKLVTKCCLFLINATEALHVKPTIKSPFYAFLEDKLSGLLQKKKNFVVNMSTFTDVMKIRWRGVWLLAQSLTKNALLANNNTKAIRRVQALELLSIVFKNHGFIQHDIKDFNKIVVPIYTNVETYAKWLEGQESVKTAEFNAIINLLLDIHKLEASAQLKTKLNWAVIGSCIQKIRETTLVSYQTYAQLCNKIGLKAIKNDGVTVPKKPQAINGKAVNQDDDESDEDEEIDEQPQPKQNGNRKRKAQNDARGKGQIDSKKQKKLKKLERMRVASLGLDGLSFDLNGNADVTID